MENYSKLLNKSRESVFDTVLTFRVNRPTKRALQKESLDSDTPISVLIRKIVEKWVEDTKK